MEQKCKIIEKNVAKKQSFNRLENSDIIRYSEKLTILKNSYYDIQELGRDISYLQEEIDFDEEEREKIETRLDFIYSLKRKYGNTIGEILDYG